MITGYENIKAALEVNEVSEEFLGRLDPIIAQPLLGLLQIGEGFVELHYPTLGNWKLWETPPMPEDDDD
jgi:hypothetical protein